MGETASAAYLHSCVKMPVKPRKRPCGPVPERNCRTVQRSETPILNASFDSVASYLEFYSNIPDYVDLNDLSDSEFYAKLNDIKETQKHFRTASCLLNDADSSVDSVIERPSSVSSLGSKLIAKNSDFQRRKFLDIPVVTPQFGEPGRKKITMNQPPKMLLSNDFERNLEPRGNRKSPDGRSSLTMDNPPRPTTKTSRHLDGEFRLRPSVTPTVHHHMCHSMSALSLHSPEMNRPLETRLRPRSKTRSKTDSSHDVPLLSRIPLFDKIMAEQEERRRINHDRYSKELQANVQPFSFTKREEEERHAILHSRSCSSTDLNRPTSSQFRARPIPNNLFSDNAYERMRENQFYRALRKRIRADEMLKHSALPPSMEARERMLKGKSQSLDCLEGKSRRRRRTRSRGYRRAQECIAQEVQTSQSCKSGKSAWLNRKPRPGSTTESSAACSPNASTLEPHQRPRPHSAFSVSRSNLASVLRVQTSRKRMESAMKDQLQDKEMEEQAKFKARLLRLSPAWRQLDYSTEEDLALRLAQRRQEARQRGARHRELMHNIYGRVHDIPPLFQQPSRLHHCHSPTVKGEKSKSLEDNLEKMGKNSMIKDDLRSRKVKSFYIDRSDVHFKSSESSQIKSDRSKGEYSASDSD